MTTEPATRSDLDEAIAAIYGGRPDEFVSRREALAKELKAAGRRDDAAAVKRLRKPTRLAWALDAAVLNEGSAAERVNTAVTDTLAVQSAGGDPRDVFGRLRLAVNGLARAAVQAAAAHGHAADHADLVQAVLAVIGVSDAFDALRAGRLADIPAAGGLDLLSLVAAAGGPGTARGAARHAEIAEPAAAHEAAAAAHAAHEVSAARDGARRADAVLAAVRDRAAAAERALHSAEAKLEVAEDQLRRAERERDARRAELDHARRQADVATAQLRDAERDAAHAHAQLERLR